MVYLKEYPKRRLLLKDIILCGLELSFWDALIPLRY